MLLCARKQIKADMREGERGNRKYTYPCINKQRKTEARIVLHDKALALKCFPRRKHAALSLPEGGGEQIKCEGDQTSLSLIKAAEYQCCKQAV